MNAESMFELIYAILQLVFVVCNVTAVGRHRVVLQDAIEFAST